MALVRTQVQLTVEQDQRLAALAHASKRSKADSVRGAVELLLIQRRAGPSQREVRSRALAAVGAFRSGKRDISANHDAYLAKIYAGEE